MKRSLNVIRYGSEAPLPTPIPLRAGPLSLIYENGDLRYIRLGDHEIVRRLYVAVRDHNWGTVPNVLTNVRMDINDDSFQIAYEVENRRGDIDFTWQATISGEAQGVITFTFEGESRSTFRRNRLGFCVLHPIRECAGTACKLEHSDGSTEIAAFPRHVAPQMYVNGQPTPHAPFVGLRAMTHQALPDVWAELRFEGEVFELEDQRNWIDASFKTYCTPLALPFPVEVPQGTRIRQQIRLSLHGTAPFTPTVDAEVVTLRWQPDASIHTLPPPGISAAGHGQSLSPSEIERLKALHLSHLRLELNLSQANWQARLEQISREAEALDLPLAITLILSDAAEAELQALAAALPQIKPRVAAWLLWHQRELVTADRWAMLARPILNVYDASVPIGAGSKANFAELNRAWPDPAHLDFISFTANPQVHAFDNASLAETPAALPALIETARQHSGGKPIALSPLTLKQQFNPVATGPEIPTPPGELPAKVDPRQMSLFGAGWTLACLKYLSESDHLHHLSLYETTGWLGVMETEAGSPLPEKFPSLPGELFPIYHLLAEVGAWRGAQVIPLVSSHPLRVEALALEKDQQRRILLANMSNLPQTVQLPEGRPALLRVMNEHEGFEAVPPVPDTMASASITLPPYALLCADYEGKTP